MIVSECVGVCVCVCVCVYKIVLMRRNLSTSCTYEENVS